MLDFVWTYCKVKTFEASRIIEIHLNDLISMQDTSRVFISTFSPAFGADGTEADVGSQASGYPFIQHTLTNIQGMKLTRSPFRLLSSCYNFNFHK